MEALTAASAATPAPPARSVFDQFPSLPMSGFWSLVLGLWSCQPQDQGLRPKALNDGEVKLLLVNCLIARDVDWTKIVLDFDQHVALARTQHFRHLMIDAQRHLLILAVAIH